MGRSISMNSVQNQHLSIKQSKEMKHKSYFKLIIGLMTLALPMISSCSDDDNYTPGAEVSDDNQNVYFPSSDNETIYLYPEDVAASQGGAMTTAIKLVREQYNGSLTVPIIVDNKSEEVTVPESVTFNDGDSIAYLNISYSNPEKGLSADFHIDESCANPYLQNDGSTYLRLSIAVLEKVCNVKYSSSTQLSGTNRSYFANVTSEIYHCLGLNKFIWKDFLGSNIDITFEVKLDDGVVFENDSIQNNSGEINFLDHVNDYYGYGYVFLMDDDGDWPTWTPEGQTVEVSYFYMYDYHYTAYSGYSGYNLIEFKKRNDDWYSGYFGNGLSIDGGTSWGRDGNGYTYFFLQYD